MQRIREKFKISWRWEHSSSRPPPRRLQRRVPFPEMHEILPVPGAPGYSRPTVMQYKQWQPALLLLNELSEVIPPPDQAPNGPYVLHNSSIWQLYARFLRTKSLKGLSERNDRTKKPTVHACTVTCIHIYYRERSTQIVIAVECTVTQL